MMIYNLVIGKTEAQVVKYSKHFMSPFFMGIIEDANTQQNLGPNLKDSPGWSSDFTFRAMRALFSVQPNSQSFTCSFIDLSTH